MRIYLAGGINANLKPLWGGYNQLYLKYKKFGIQPFWSELCNYFSQDANRDISSLLTSYGGVLNEIVKKTNNADIFSRAKQQEQYSETDIIRKSGGADMQLYLAGVMPWREGGAIQRNDKK